MQQQKNKVLPYCHSIFPHISTVFFSASLVDSEGKPGQQKFHEKFPCQLPTCSINSLMLLKSCLGVENFGRRWFFGIGTNGVFSLSSQAASPVCHSSEVPPAGKTGEAQNQHGTVLDVHWLFHIKSWAKTGDFLTANKNTFQPRKSLPFSRQEPCIKAICDTKEVTFHGGKAYPVPHIAWPGRTIQCFDIITAGILPFHCRMLGCWHFEVCSLNAAQIA